MAEIDLTALPVGTTPNCEFIGGHRAGYDDECAWCARAAVTN